jgi:two-component sensor histidine kinase
MMVLYDKLYRSKGFNRMSAMEYLSPLIDEIIGNLPNRGMVKVEKKIEDFILDARVLSPLGILINELLTNAMKSAFIGRENGVISVSAAIQENHVTIVIQDNGIGIPETVDLKDSPGFGLQLVEMLAEQMEGRIRIERRNGTKFILEFEV